MTVYGYYRISQESGESVSIETQDADARSYYAARRDALGSPYVPFADRDVSGGVPLARRPEGRKLWERLQRGDHLIVAKIDRVFRSMVDGAQVIEQLERRGVGLHLLDLHVDTTTPAGRAIAHVMIAFADFERRRIGERRRDAARHRRANGLPTCDGTHQPLGWRIVRDADDGSRRYVAWPDERRQCRQVARWRADKGLTYLAILGKTIDRGWCNLRTGGPWSRARVRRALIAARENFPLISYDVRHWGAERVKSPHGGDDDG